MDRKVVLLVFVCVLLFSAVSGTGVVERGVDLASSGGSRFEVLSGSGQSGSVDWWPMFHHDLSHSGYSTSTAPNTNHTIWSYTTSAWVLSSPAVVGGSVYVGSYDGNVYCLDAFTGTKLWNTLVYYVYSSPAVADGKVYVGSYDNKTYCLDALTGAHIWSYTTGDYVLSSPAVADGRVYVGSDDHNVYCLDASTGTKIWNYTTGWDVDSSPAVADGSVYVGSYDHNVYCLNASTGTKIWNYKTGDIVRSSPAVVGGSVYVGSGDDNVYCLDASTGTKIWNYTTGWDVDSSPAVADGRVYVGSYDHNVYCLDASTGTKIWNYTTGYWVESSPAVADGKVYIGSEDCNVYCLDASTGTKIWNYKTGYVVYSSPAVANGRVYVGSADRKVYAFGLAQTVYINADGSISPVRAPIVTSDKITYNFTGDISYPTYYGIVVERSNIVIDGKGYTVQGNQSGNGLYLKNMNNVTIKNTNIKSFRYGIILDSSSNNTVSGNNITNNRRGILLISSSNYNSISGNNITNNSPGIWLESSSNYNSISGNNITNNLFSIYPVIFLLGSSNNTVSGNNITTNKLLGIGLNNSSNNTVSGNNITNNACGVLLSSSNNTFYHNNFVDNTQQVSSDGYANIWDNGYPSGGNYWSDYTDDDFYRGPYQNITGSDSIGDTPYIINANNQDRYPLMKTWPPHQIVQTSIQIAGKDYPITIESNATITSVVITRSTLHFKTSGPDGTIGYINFTLPADLNKTAITVFVDGVKLTPPPFPIITTNSTHYFVYFEFTTSTHEITIQYAITNIATTNVTPAKTIVGQGYTIRINATIQNQGDYEETFNITLYANTTFITTQTITLTSGNSTTITFTLNTTGFAKGKYTISAHAWPVPDETDTTDNTYSDGWVIVTIVGDVDGDFDCDADDVFTYISPAYGTKGPPKKYPADPNYNPNCDFDGDGDVDADDVFMYLAPNYGKKDC